MTLTLEGITIPACSTIGYGYGVDEDGCPGRFVADHRPLRQLGEGLVAAGEPIVVD